MLGLRTGGPSFRSGSRGTPGVLKGRAIGVANATATILAALGLAGSAIGAATAVGAVSVQALLAGSAVGRALATGALSVGGYDAASSSYFAAMSVQPSEARKALVDALVVGLKADGLWTAFAGGWISIAGHDGQAMCLNLRNPVQALSPVNSPVFTVDRGYAGDGTSSHLVTPVNASDAYSTTAGTIGIWINVAPAVANADVLGVDANNRIRMGTAKTAIARLATTTNISLTGTGNHKTVVKTGSGSLKSYEMGSPDQTVTGLTDSAPPASAFMFLRAATYANTRMAAGYFCPTALSDAQVSALHGRLNTYLTAIGAN